MSARILTLYAPLKIDYRGCDWCAYRDGYEPGATIGYGSTEDEARADLLAMEAADTVADRCQREIERRDGTARDLVESLLGAALLIVGPIGLSLGAETIRLLCM